MPAVERFPVSGLAATVLATKSGGSMLTLLLPLVIVFGLMYLLIIRPNQRRQQQQRSMQSTISIGSKVLLGGGLIGEIIAVRDDEFDVRLSADSTATVIKQGVLKVLTPAEPSPDITPEEPPAAADGNAG